MTNAIAFHDMKQNNECFMDFLYDFMDFLILSYLFSFRYLICYQTSLKYGTGDAVNSSGYKQINLFLQIVHYTLVWSATK